MRRLLHLCHGRRGHGARQRGPDLARLAREETWRGRVRRDAQALDDLARGRGGRRVRLGGLVVFVFAGFAPDVLGDVVHAVAAGARRRAVVFAHGRGGHQHGFDGERGDFGRVPAGC